MLKTGIPDMIPEKKVLLNIAPLSPVLESEGFKSPVLDFDGPFSVKSYGISRN